MSDRVRVVSANLWNGVVDPERFADLVETLEADVVCTQEMTPEQAEALALVLPHGRLEPARDHNGMGIALRRPAALDRVPLPKRDAHLAELEPEAWPGLTGSLEIACVHIQAPHVPPLALGWSQRRGQLAGLERWLDEARRRPRLLVGDLNATPVWPLYRRLARRLQDAALVHARRRGERPARTWGPGPRSPRVLRIDHILVDRVHVEELRVVRIPDGDHSAVVADVAPDPA